MSKQCEDCGKDIPEQYIFCMDCSKKRKEKYSQNNDNLQKTIEKLNWNLGSFVKLTKLMFSYYLLESVDKSKQHKIAKLILKDLDKEIKTFKKIEEDKKNES